MTWWSNLKYRAKGLEKNQVIVKAMTERLSQSFDVFDKILAKQAYMGGDRFSLIDIFYMPYINKLFASSDGNLITDRPNVKAWWERVTARDSWKFCLALHDAPLSGLSASIS
jgi:glutathione S-transferase